MVAVAIGVVEARQYLLPQGYFHPRRMTCGRGGETSEAWRERLALPLICLQAFDT